jgi:hypothetical protein
MAAKAGEWREPTTHHYMVFPQQQHLLQHIAALLSTRTHQASDEDAKAVA